MFVLFRPPSAYVEKQKENMRDRLKFHGVSRSDDAVRRKTRAPQRSSPYTHALINDKLYLCYSVPVKSYRFCCTHTRLSVYRTRGDAGVGREEQQEEDVEQTGGETKKKKKKKTRQQIRAPTHSGNFRNGIACIYI